ncbi:MAG TPA: hypothetical protein PLC19_03205, partial [Marmoricola sp.]|nr:hypothetical protein [Marmoricola sp.]
MSKSLRLFLMAVLVAIATVGSWAYFTVAELHTADSVWVFGGVVQGAILVAGYQRRLSVAAAFS